MAIFPKIYKTLELSLKADQLNNRYHYAAIVKGRLYATGAGYYAIRISLSIYFDEEQIEKSEGRLLDAETLKAMAGAGVKEITLTESGVEVTDSKRTQPFFYAGVQTEGASFALYDSYTGKPKGEKLEHFWKTTNELIKSVGVGSYPTVGLAADTLMLLSECFYNSINKHYMLSVAMPAGDSASQPTKGMLVKPANELSPNAEIALFMPVEIPGLEEMEDLV